MTTCDNTPTIGDRVTALGNPFWMRVTSCLPNGRLVCSFGSSGRVAGTWGPDELALLEEYTGALYRRFDALHDRYNLSDRADTDPALRALLGLMNDSLCAVARLEGVQPADVSLVPALAASLAQKSLGVGRAQRQHNATGARSSPDAVPSITKEQQT